MNLISLLSQILGDFKEFGRGEYYFACPFCHNSKRKFAVNVNKKMFHCWHCNAKGRNLISLFKRLHVSPAQLNELRQFVSEDDINNYHDDVENIQLHLPEGFTPLWVHSTAPGYTRAINYLHSRNITEVDIIRYQLGYTVSGRYANRIIIPSYDANNTLNYFVARTMNDFGVKYMNPPVSKNIVMFENQINWKLPIVLVEGAFDAIAVRRNAIPILGKTIPKKLMAQILRNKVSEVYVALDDDAELAAMQLEEKLSQYGISVKLVNLDGKDPSVLGFDDTWACIYRSKSTGFTEYINKRLQLL